MKKIIFFNLLIFLFIISAVLILSPIAMDMYRYYTSSKSESTKHTYPNYSKSKWAKQHFIEFKKLRTSYFDYIVWRRNDFKGNTITIKNGIRLNNAKEDFKLEKDIWVFGGSTVWGTGSRDHETIPALLEKQTGISTLNLGEVGYTSTQELNLLIKNLILHKPKTVIFYDGVNDISQKCRSDIEFYSTDKEQVIKKKLKSSEYFKHTEKLIEPPLKIINYIKTHYLQSSQETKKHFDCDTNSKKREQIIKSLIQNWQIVKLISEKEKIKFIPILQPIAYTTNSKIEHLKIKENKELKLQFEILYPEIKKELNRLQIDYIDLEKSLDSEGYYFIDFCHLSPNGNEEIVKKIISSNLYRD
tara:strand:- start:248 stop:1321 length:1074 start_codon:yes stop_codon:yes gene_type:complete